MQNQMRPNIVGLFTVLLAAEVGSSLWCLLTLPTDTYLGSLNYIGGRLLFWSLLIALFSVLWFLLGWRLGYLRHGPEAERRVRRQLSHTVRVAVAFGTAFAVELMTTACYWASSLSTGVRALYQSVWYWHRVPRQSDYGWPSLRGYLVDHLVPWAVIFVTGLLIWFISSKRRRAQRNVPLAGESSSSTR